MDVRPLELRAADGFTLHATLYDASSTNVTFVAGAMGVKRRYYDAFARFMTERGRSVVTIDYRGIGDSRPRTLRGFDATMADWGRFDIDAALAWIAGELRPASLTYVGHSAGGQLAALAPHADRVAAGYFASL